MQRQDVLNRASEMIDGARQDTYGDPAESFARAAQIWSAILGTPVSPAQVAMCLAGVKLSRLAHTHDHEDSWVDLAGYAAVGAEVAARYRAAEGDPSGVEGALPTDEEE